MSNVKNHIISIIHGANRLTDPINYQDRWPDDLANHLSAKGFHYVKPFYWSGEVLDIYNKKVIELYIDHLCGIVKNSEGRDSKLTIIAKSYGAIIAEKAIQRMSKKVNVDLLMRIATPDIRNSFYLPNVDRVVNIKSKTDILYYMCLLPSTALLFTSGLFMYPKTHPDCCFISKAKHSDFNRNYKINIGNLYHGYMFDLYEKILLNSIVL